MKFFSSCRGHCYTCTCTKGCLAGHGDDDYTPISKVELLNRIEIELENIDKFVAGEITDLSILKDVKKRLKIYYLALDKGSW